MLKELANAFTGSLVTTGFSNPSGYGINSVPPKAVFKKMFNNLISAFSNTPGNTFGAFPGAYSGTSNQAVSAYANARGGGFQGQAQLPFPGQFQPPFPYQFSSGITTSTGNRKKGRALPPGPIAPGAVVINSVSQIQGQPQSNSISPIQALVGTGFGAPIQGSAIQNGQGGFGGGFSTTVGQFGPIPPNINQPKGGLGGLLSFIVVPIFSLFSAVKLLYQMTKRVNIMKPVVVDASNSQYNQFTGYLDEASIEEEGSFDEYEDYEPTGSSVVEGGLESSFEESGLDLAQVDQF